MTGLGLAVATAIAVGVPAEAPREVYEMTLLVGGARIHALCTSGARDVLFLHDAGDSADAWRSVLERLDGSVGACAYDRRGSGQSRPAPDSRGWYELLDELRGIHRALGFEHDYVLVGHGLGGLYARLYASDRPREVGALLLIDPAHEDLPRLMEAGMPQDEWSRWLASRRRPNRDGVREERVGDRARRARLPRVPVTVITSVGRLFPAGWEQRFARESAQQAHEHILAGAAYARHIPAEHTRHTVALEEPDLIVAEVGRLRGFLGR